MNLDERDLKKIKSLHVMLKMPIWILEKETNKVLKSYESIYKHPISYEFKERNISEEVVQFYSGMLNEIFFLFSPEVSDCGRLHLQYQNKPLLFNHLK